MLYVQKADTKLWWLFPVLTLFSIMVSMKNNEITGEIVSRHKQIWGCNRWLYIAIEPMFVCHTSLQVQDKKSHFMYLQYYVLDSECVFQQRVKKKSCILSQCGCLEYGAVVRQNTYEENKLREICIDTHEASSLSYS